MIYAVKSMQIRKQLKEETPRMHRKIILGIAFAANVTKSIVDLKTIVLFQLQTKVIMRFMFRSLSFCRLSIALISYLSFLRA